MSAAEYVFDPVDYPAVDACEQAARNGMEIEGTPTASMHRRGLNLVTQNGGSIMSKSTIRSLAYFMIVGGVIVWVVGHLAPIRA